MLIGSFVNLREVTVTAGILFHVNNVTKDIRDFYVPSMLSGDVVPVRLYIPHL